MKRDLLIAAFMAGILIGAVAQGFADDEPSATSPTDGRRQVEARITDWQNDKALQSKASSTDCAVSALDGIILPAPLEPVSSPEYSAQILKLRAHPGALAGLTLTADETAELQELQRDPGSSPEERAQFQIDIDKFVIRTTNRIYDGAIDYSLQQAEDNRLAGGIFGDLYRKQDLCAAEESRIERDNALIAEGQQILPLYDRLGL